MTSAAPSINETDRAFPKPRRNVFRALGALRRLFADKEDTSQVFEIMRSLNGPASRDAYLRLLTTAEGGRLAYEHHELAPKLMDRAWLETLPAGSVGAAYAEFTARENLSAEGLAEESRRGRPEAEIDRAHPYAWFGRRMRDTHDIWHILTGYGRDATGEACLVAFSYQQTRGLGWALIATGAFLKARGKEGRPYRVAILEASRRGKAAAWLPAQDYERLLAEPLDAARARLKITPPIAYQAISPDARNPVI